MGRKLLAFVQKASGKTTHTWGTLDSDGPRALGQFSCAARVEVVQEGEGFFLLRFDAEGQFCGDTWHASEEDAKKQAEFEYEITNSDWRAEPSAPPSPES